MYVVFELVCSSVCDMNNAKFCAVFLTFQAKVRVWRFDLIDSNRLIQKFTMNFAVDYAMSVICLR